LAHDQERLISFRLVQHDVTAVSINVLESTGEIYGGINTRRGALAGSFVHVP
jgi:hypothetical protein